MLDEIGTAKRVILTEGYFLWYWDTGLVKTEL